MNDRSSVKNNFSALIVTWVLLGSLFVGIPFLGDNAQAVVTWGTATGMDNYDPNPVHDNSPGFPVLAFGATDAGAGNTLTRVDVTVERGPGWWENFNAVDGACNGISLQDVTTNGAVSGVALYMDDGDTDDQLDVNDTVVPLSNVGCNNIGAGDDLITLWPNNEQVPDNMAGANQFHWFIVFRTNLGATDGEHFETYFQQNDIWFSTGQNFPNWDTPGNPAMYNIRKITGDDTVSDDPDPSFTGAWIGNSGVAVNDDVAIGLRRMADGGYGEVIDFVNFTVINNSVGSGSLENSDLLQLSTNSSASGFGLYRDDGTTDDSWDGSDTPIWLEDIQGGLGDGYIFVDMDNVSIPDQREGLHEFFFVVRTSATISTDDMFAIRLDTQDMNIDGIVDENKTVPENPATASNIRADVDDPTVSSDGWTEDSLYTHVDANGKLWFSHQMPAPVTVTVSGQASDAESGIDTPGNAVAKATFTSEASLLTSPGDDQSAANWAGDYQVWTTSTAVNSPVTATIYDDVGNSDGFDYDYALDTTGPVVQINNPNVGDILGGDVVVTASLTDNEAGVLWAEVSYDNGVTWNGMAWNGVTWEHTWNTGATNDGKARVSIRSYDNVMNTRIGSANVVLDNTGPVVTSLNPVHGALVPADTPDDDPIWIIANAVDVQNVTGVEVSIDGGAWTNLTYNEWAMAWVIDWHDPGQGQHDLRFRATDAGGNLGGISSILVRADGIPPTVDFISPNAGDALAGDQRIAVDASDDIGVGGAWASFDASSNIWFPMVYDSIFDMFVLDIDTTEVPDGPYNLEARVQDLAGNEATTVALPIIIDNELPTLQVLRPVDDGLAGGVYDVQAIATDDISHVGTVDFRVDGGLWKVMEKDGNGTYRYDFDTTGLEDGLHALMFRAMDDAGNTVTSDISITVDNIVPTGTILSPIQDQFVEGIFVFEVAASDNHQIDQVELTFSGDSSISDMGTVPTTLGLDSGRYEYRLDTTIFTNGRAAATPTVTDKAGNVFEGLEVSFYLDNDASEIDILSPTDGALVEGKMDVKVEVLEDFSEEISYQLGSGRWTVMTEGNGTWNGDIDTTALADGEYRLTVKAEDTAGHSVTEGIDITIDNNAPTMIVISPREGQALTGVLKIEIWAEDEIGVTESTASAGDWSSGLVLDPTAGMYWAFLDTLKFPDGPLDITVTAKDAIGHETTSTISIATFNYPEAAPPIGIFVHPIADQVVGGTIDVTVSAEDEQGVKDVDLSVTGGPSIKMARDLSTGYYTIRLDTTTLTDGSTVLDATLTNVAGKSTIITVTVIVDNSGPSITITKISTVEGEASIRATVDDLGGVETVQYKVDGSDWHEMAKVGDHYEAYWYTDVNDNGRHIIEVRAVDSLGNEARESTKVEVDNFDWFAAGMISLVVIILVLVALTMVLSFKRRGRGRAPIASLLEEETPAPREKKREYPEMNEETTPEPEETKSEGFVVPPLPHSLAEKEAEAEAGSGETTTEEE